MWISTRVLVFSGSVLAGSGAVGGWAIYNVLNKDVEASKLVKEKGDAFWDSKIDELKKKLIELRKEGQNKDKDLTQKIVENIQTNAFFDLNNTGDDFVQKHKSGAQRITLAGFCIDNGRKSKIDQELAKKLCE